jgi:REP element-mobilizing transposase RayT
MNMPGIDYDMRRQAKLLAAIQHLQEATCKPEEIEKFLARVNTILNEKRVEGEAKGQATDEEDDSGDGIIEFWHVTSRIHLRKFLLDRDEIKEILARECLHYARVCRIALVNYCIMDNHFHLIVGITKTSLKLSKMLGCIKQQFTNKFKVWFNEVYRPANRYRRAALGNGTLWEGPAKPERIKDAAQLQACTLYLENNRLVVDCKEKIGALEQTPCFILTPDSDPEGKGKVEFSLQDDYVELIECLKSYRFQSAGYFLGALDATETYLTNGHDGNWASASEVETYFKVAAKKLPEGWRKCWFKECRGILKPTSPEKRTFTANPFFEELGKTRNLRAAHFGRMLLESCYKKRNQIAELETEPRSVEPGATLD